MAGQWEDWFEREEFIGQISDMRVQNLQVEREVVQKRTFTRWMNLHLEKCNPPIEVHDLFRDIQDGHILMALLEELSGCKLLHGFKKSSHRIFRLNNIAKVLSFLEERNVKLVSIDATDVADGNSSIILGLIWNIILFFQIKELTGNIRSQFPSSSSLSSIPTSSDSDTSICNTPSDERQLASTAMREQSKAIKKLLQWVQKRTRKFGVAVQDFGKSWTSGLAFLAVIKSIDRSLVDMRKALLRTARENLEDAFRIAHYSLGIPRLLEPEDLTINAPDEQSIMTYVSQFLEHFPGIEEQEESCQLIERSVSMCRLNFRDSDSDHMRNGAHGSRVRERSYMFQREYGQPPPKILISSVSEDRSAMSPPYRKAATRSWSSVDFLADSPHKEDISSSVVKETKETANKVAIDSTSNSPQMCYAQSPTGSLAPESVNTESVMGDSAISSSDSWVDSEFGVIKFSESQSDSSLCDSGTAWEVYRATPVEITTFNEESDPSIGGRAPDEQSITESYIDEGIYSHSSLEKDASHIDYNQDTALEKLPNHVEEEITKEADTNQSHTSSPKKDEVPREQGPPPPVYSEEHNIEESSNRDPECLKKVVDIIGDAQDCEEVEVETKCQKTNTSAEETKGESREESGILKERDEVVVTQDKASEGVLRDDLNPQGSCSSETFDALANTHPTNQVTASKTSQDLSMGINIPLISISSEPEKQAEEGKWDQERQDHACYDEAHKALANGTKAIDMDVNSPQIPDRVSHDSNDKNLVEITSCLVSENVTPTTSEQVQDTESGLLVDTDECEASKSLNTKTYGSDKIDNMKKSDEHESPQHDSQTVNTEKDLTASSTDGTSQPVNTEPEIVLTDQLERHHKLGYTFSKNVTVTAQQNTSDPVKLKHNGNLFIAEDSFYTDFNRNSPMDDLVGDVIEPMDLFYPDKEDPMFTESLDTEMQSWPSVFSVSALQPAPASETLLDDQPLILLEDFKNGVDLIQEKDKVITTANQETDRASEPQKHCLLPREEIGGLWGGNVPADSSDLSEAEQQSPGSARENTQPVRSDAKSSTKPDESQVPPVLRHRKGLHFTESTDNQIVMTIKADNGDSELWWNDNWELYLLLLLWLLLYCFWLLPQMDLKTLPSLLLNLNQ